MAVSKFYAIWKKSDKEKVVVNAFDALALKGRAQIVTTPKEKASLYDIETDLKVAPKHGRKKDGVYQGQPYFIYYPGDERPLKDTDGNFEYSSELNVFLEAFKSIKKFQIQYGKRTALIFPKSISLMERVSSKDDKKFFIVKLLIDIDETWPYSEYYRLNGKLGIEFYKTSRPGDSKRTKLAEMGIPLFEAKAQFPKSTKIFIPDEFTSSEEVKMIAEKVREVYQDRDYKLFGTFTKYHLEAFKFQEGYERKYRTLKSYEDQCQELEARIKKLQNEVTVEKQRLNQVEKDVEQAETRLQYYRDRDESYKKLERDSDFLKQKNAQLQDDYQQLEAQSKHLRQERDLAQEETIRLKNRTWWQRLLNRP